MKILGLDAIILDLISGEFIIIEGDSLSIKQSKQGNNDGNESKD